MTAFLSLAAHLAAALITGAGCTLAALALGLGHPWVGLTILLALVVLAVTFARPAERGS